MQIYVCLEAGPVVVEHEEMVSYHPGFLSVVVLLKCQCRSVLEALRAQLLVLLRSYHLLMSTCTILPTTHYSPLTTYPVQTYTLDYVLLTTYCLLRTTYYILLATYYLYLLISTYYPYLLPTTYYDDDDDDDYYYYYNNNYYYYYHHYHHYHYHCHYH